MLDATTRLHVATGVVNIWKADAAELAASFHRIEAKHPGRFLLGIGSGHREATPERVRPLEAMSRYLDVLDENDVPVRRRVISALGPRMLALAAERSAGTHPYLTIPAQSAEERAVLGSDVLVAPEQTIVLDPDRERARRSARTFLTRYLGMSNYTTTMQRGGFTEHDVEWPGSDTAGRRHRGAGRCGGPRRARAGAPRRRSGSRVGAGRAGARRRARRAPRARRTIAPRLTRAGPGRGSITLRPTPPNFQRRPRIGYHVTLPRRLADGARALDCDRRSQTVDAASGEVDTSGAARQPLPRMARLGIRFALEVQTVHRFRGADHAGHSSRTTMQRGIARRPGSRTAEHRRRWGGSLSFMTMANTRRRKSPHCSVCPEQRSTASLSAGGGVLASCEAHTF